LNRKADCVPKFTWNVDPALFHIGNFEIRYYSLIFVVVFLGGYALFNWQVKRGGGDEEEAGDFFVYGVLGVLIGARLGHVIFYDYKKALEDPTWIVKIWTGGLASHGAVMGLIIAMWLYTKRRGIPFLEGADRFSFSAALGATLVRLGNFINSEIVGRPVPDQSWGVLFPRFIVNDKPDTLYRYPTQFYEMGIGLLVLGALFLADRTMGKERRPRGAMISIFFLLYFAGRFVVEYWKDPQGIDPSSPLTMGQYLSIPGFFVGLYGLYWSFARKIPTGWAPASDDYDDEESEDEDDEDDASQKKSKKAKKRMDPDVAAEFAEGAKRRRASDDD
jgi:prolipoprotein diacylglyceryl transferase